MKKLILSAALAAACAAFAATSAYAAPPVPPQQPAAPPAPEETVTPPSRSYMDSVIRAEQEGTARMPMKGIIKAYREMGKPKKAPKAPKAAPAEARPAPETPPAEDLRPARPPRPESGPRYARRDGEAPRAYRDDVRGPRAERAAWRDDDRRPAPAPRHMRARHHYDADGSLYCPYGYEHRRGGCPYYAERHASYYDDDRCDDYDDYDDGWYDDDGYYHHRTYRHHRGGYRRG